MKEDTKMVMGHENGLKWMFSKGLLKLKFNIQFAPHLFKSDKL